jgi:hypothetical protein
MRSVCIESIAVSNPVPKGYIIHANDNFLVTSSEFETGAQALSCKIIAEAVSMK